MNFDGAWNELTSLMDQAGFRGPFQLYPLAGGSNNRVFRVEIGSSLALLKVYFHDREDTRDRLGAEFAFSSFAWEHGVRTLPQPLALDRANHWGLFEFIPGKKLGVGEVNLEAVETALGFVRGLNRHRAAARTSGLGNASEACFSIADHLRTVHNRVDRLRRIPDAGGIHSDAIRVVEEELVPFWYEIERSAVRRANDLALLLDEVADEVRCLSPSDFGFHNAIRGDDGLLRFIDFEYSGWDDPAKLVCDFFCQPAVPVPSTYFGRFVDGIVTGMPVPETYRQRIDLLLPVIQVKWCCILLNDFLRVGNGRREFANPAAETAEERKHRQLGKAQRALEKLRNGVR